MTNKIEWIEFEKEDIMISYLSKQNCEKLYFKCENLKEMKKCKNLIEVKEKVEKYISRITEQVFKKIEYKIKEKEYLSRKKVSRFEIMDI